MRVPISVCTRMSRLIPFQFVNLAQSPIGCFGTVPVMTALFPQRGNAPAQVTAADDQFVHGSLPVRPTRMAKSALELI